MERREKEREGGKKDKIVSRSTKGDKEIGLRTEIEEDQNRMILFTNVRAYVPVLSSSGHRHWGTDIHYGR